MRFSGFVAGAAGSAWVAFALPVSAATAPPLAVDQGAKWTAQDAAQFYVQDQGSQIMPLSWMRALKRSDGRPFLSESLQRYGYLPNPASPTPDLPVGFTVNGGGAEAMVGMTCAACHTRQIEVNGQAYRIDGGPAIVDFQAFLADLDASAAAVLGSAAQFDAFATDVLGSGATDRERAALRSAFETWFTRYDTLMQRALPYPGWGPGRLDAVAMIFNRLTGLDIGKPPTYLIPHNIHSADAPVRYPFLWNATIQDHTQWPGFADNGSPVLGLARNLGEVFGVFATFMPQKGWFGIDYLSANSANFPGLITLEKLVDKIGPPRWPFAINAALAKEGKAIFDRPTADGGCVSCHGIKPGVTRFPFYKTWATPVLAVGTDAREYQSLEAIADTGVLNGASSLLDPTPLMPTDASFKILGLSVIATITQYCTYNPITCALNLSVTSPLGASALDAGAGSGLRDLRRLFRTTQPVQAKYESRVLEGIWAAAPYLHNGSVPTLAELLTPPAQRVRVFAVGSNYDPVNVGLAATQQQFGSYLYRATGCDDVKSGNSNCGHDYGTRLSASEKAALLEYLKTL